MIRIMIDIETMGTHTSESLILSVGLVAFILRKSGPVIVNQRLVVFNPGEQLLNRRVEPDTQRFWAKQTDEARAHWIAPPLSSLFSTNAGCMEIIKWYFSQGDGKAEVWANGVVFDLGNLENLMRSVGLAPPWPYNAARDTRTIWKCFPKLREAERQETDNAHDPIWDCIRQIRDLWENLPTEFLEEDPPKATESVTVAIGGGPAGGWISGGGGNSGG